MYSTAKIVKKNVIRESMPQAVHFSHNGKMYCFNVSDIAFSCIDHCDLRVFVLLANGKIRAATALF